MVKRSRAGQTLKQRKTAETGSELLLKQTNFINSAKRVRRDFPSPAHETFRFPPNPLGRLEPLLGKKLKKKHYLSINYVYFIYYAPPPLPKHLTLPFSTIETLMKSPTASKPILSHYLFLSV